MVPVPSIIAGIFRITRSENTGAMGSREKPSIPFVGWRRASRVPAAPPLCLCGRDEWIVAALGGPPAHGCVHATPLGRRRWIAEAAEPRWGDVDLDRGEIIVRRVGGKGGKSRVVPVCAELSDELRSATSRRPGDAVIDRIHYCQFRWSSMRSGHRADCGKLFGVGPPCYNDVSAVFFARAMLVRGVRRTPLIGSSQRDVYDNFA